MPADMNKSIAEASLDHLNDIIVPDAIGFFPLAPGWYMVLLLLISLFFYGSAQVYKYYKKSQYRREALEELSLYQANDKEQTIAMLLLAKRVGIAAYGRQEVANLSGDSWWDFMEEHSMAKVDTGMRQEISALLYDAAYTMDNRLFGNVKESVLLWIKTHGTDRDV
ncbi:MAG: DUF4381 domain-containing protein [Campylobacterota bacterium]|nr:DUF4381 domain-containing protein [Campylobacterota bacterium]